jgi:cellulose 1,4-beta-cellobiosidase
VPNPDVLFVCSPGSSSGGGGSSGGSGGSGGSSSASASKTSSASSAPTASSTPAADNPYNGYTAYPSNFYAAEVQAAAAQITDATTKAAALSVADIPSFTWFDQVAKVPQLGWLLGNATAVQTSSGKKQIVQIIVYDLPDRDCAANASNGEFSYATGGAAQYENYIDQIVAQVKRKFTIS